MYLVRYLAMSMDGEFISIAEVKRQKSRLGIEDLTSTLANFSQSWLSAILSANSVCLHIALVEGFNIAWWYRATRADACVADLHTIWLHGTSSFSALKSGRSFNYIALATLFVATVPLNGFILQNAISVDSTLVDSKVNMTYTTRTSLPLGWSGSTSNQSSVVTVPLPSLALSQIVGNSFSGIQSADFSTGGSGCASGAICSALMPSVGFWAECNSSSLPYDLPNDSSSNITTNATLFTSAITWTNSNPNDVDIRVQWKPVNEDATGPCKGTYKVKECKLRAASLLQPVQVTSFIPQTNLGPAFPHFTLNLDSSYTYTSDKLDEILPILPNEGITNSTYGGIASIMEKFLTGSVNISYLEGKPSIISEGLYSNVVGIASNSMNTPDPGPMSTCNITAGSSSSIDFGDQIINAIRQLVWTSVTNDALSSAITSGNPQHTLFQGTQSNPENHYKIIWIYWIGSLIITLSIVLAVTPIFWGFWALGRKTTMSPFETARVCYYLSFLCVLED